MIREAAEGDYDSFYESELLHRNIMNYPPYSDIIAVGLVSDSAEEAMKYAVEELGATEVGKDEIYGVDCDIFAPCALGAVINSKTIPQLECKAVAGAANNVIYDDAAGEALKAKGILYAPDFIINSGGVINAGQEAFTTYDKDKVIEQVHKIYDTISQMLEESKKTGKPEGVIATEYAESIIYK